MGLENGNWNDMCGRGGGWKALVADFYSTL